MTFLLSVAAIFAVAYGLFFIVGMVIGAAGMVSGALLRRFFRFFKLLLPI